MSTPSIAPQPFKYLYFLRMTRSTATFSQEIEKWHLGASLIWIQPGLATLSLLRLGSWNGHAEKLCASCRDRVACDLFRKYVQAEEAHG